MPTLKINIKSKSRKGNIRRRVLVILNGNMSQQQMKAMQEYTTNLVDKEILLLSIPEDFKYSVIRF